MRRAMGSVLAAAVVLTVLTGCTPEIRGMTAIVGHESGAPLAIFEPCDGDISGWGLSSVGPEGDPLETLIRWESDDGPANYDISSLLSATDDVTRYELWAFTPSLGALEQSRNLERLTFTFADIAALADGDVLYPGEQWDSDPRTGSLEEFEAAACAAG